MQGSRQCYCIQHCNIKISFSANTPQQQQEGMQKHKICLYIRTSKKKIKVAHRNLFHQTSRLFTWHIHGQMLQSPLLRKVRLAAKLLRLAASNVHEYGNFRHTKNSVYKRVCNAKPSHKPRAHLYAKLDNVFLHIFNSVLICFMFGQTRQPLQQFNQI